MTQYDKRMDSSAQSSALETIARKVYQGARRRSSTDSDGEISYAVQPAAYDRSMNRVCGNDNNSTNDNKAQRQQQKQHGAHALFLITLVVIAALIALLPSPTAAAPAAPRAKSAEDTFSRYMTKRSTDESEDSEPADFDDAVFSGVGRVSAMRPMLPDKWSNLFLTHQERSFFPTGYGGGYASAASGYGGGAFGGYGNSAVGGNGAATPGYGMEKRRRGIDETPQFVDHYVNLVEPGRFEWNFNRL